MAFGNGASGSVLEQVALLVARLGPCGLSPIAPGTVGSAAAALVAPWVFFPLSLPLRCGFLVILFFVGAWCAGHAEQVLGSKDPSSVVVDELVGQWLTFLPFSLPSVPLLTLGFIFFRLFDIWKPWPIKASEIWLPGGYGIMLDDVFAGLYAMAALMVCSYFFAESLGL